MTLVLAALCALAVATPAWAADGDFTGTAETTITATNVVAGDSVQYYQLIEWDTANNNWKLTTLGESCGVTLANLIDGISESEAGTIATSLAGATKTGDMTAGTPTTTFTATNVTAGLYYLRAIPAAGNKDTIYNPAFVSADYYEGGNTVDFSSNYDKSTVVKKSSVPFEKEVDSEEDTFVDVKPNDVIPFKVTTKIPSFGSSFTNPKFIVDDTLSDGLTLEGDVTVSYYDIDTKTTKTATDSVADVFTLTKKADGKGYTVTFNKSYLTQLDGANPDVEITYSAKVTADGSKNVTYMDNKAKLTFSNTPTTDVDKEDITRHYTFAIDGDLLGHTGEEGSELIKTGHDASGNPVTGVTKTYHEETYGVLEGATFKLVGVAGTATAGVEKTASSDENGRINFDGLDAGTYKLTEESAPAGYVKDSREFTVTIIPTYDETITDLLVSYEITITAENYDGGATFSMTNDGGTTVTSSAESATNPINNTPGAELPSTGGMGTTILYTVGGILIAAGGIWLVTKKRLSAME